MWGCETQEIPASFTAETGWPVEEDCALVTSISTVKEWPLRFMALPDMLAGVSAVSICAGWPNFVHDQQLGYGAFLTFEIVDERRLVVSIHRRALAHADSSQKHLVQDCREPEHCRKNIPCLSSRRGLHELLSDSRPHFQRTLRKTHTKKCASCRMVSWNPKSISCTHSFGNCRDVRPLGSCWVLNLVHALSILS